MDYPSRQPGAGRDDDTAPEVGIPVAHSATGPHHPEEEFDETLLEETSALIEDGRNYVEAELAFQKTRAKFAGKLAGASLGLVVLALILLHIALLALAVGLVIALAPLVTIWGAILIVVGGLLLLVGWLGWMALKRAQRLGDLFSSDGEDA